MTTDDLINGADLALRTLFAVPRAARPYPVAAHERPRAATLSAQEKALSGALMRVNHVGEVCAQALYTAQGVSSKSVATKQAMAVASKEEGDHLAWTRQRLDELGARPSLLNPLWYAGAFGIGLLAGRLGDRWSLGFVVETERQVEAHLQGHLARLPENDTASRAIVAQMQADEARHAADAQNAGAHELPAPAKALMALASKVMTTCAYRV